MKNFLLSIFIATSFPLIGQWQEMTPDTEFYQDRIYFHTPSHGIVIGLSGTYQTTHDGGITWDTAYIINADYSLNPGSVWNHDLRSIDFPSDSIGYYGGEDGFFFKSTDSGVSWKYWARVGQFDHIFDVKFFNNDTGVAETGHYALWRTIDGGVTWNWSVISQAEPFRFAKVNDSTMLFCGRGIFRTTDYGASWQRMNCDSSITLIDINMADSIHGVAAGENGVLVRTIDGGITWTSPTIATSADINAVEMLNDTFGFIGCGNYYTANNSQDVLGFIMYTMDGGSTWSQPDTICSRSIKDIEFPADSMGFACAWSGQVLRTQHPTVFTNYTLIEERTPHQLKIYPNPAREVLYVVLPDLTSTTSAEFSIHDLAGRQVTFQQKLSLAPYQLDISSLPSGVYFLHCTVNGAESVSKFIVQ